jgi:hypothetical protein
MSSSPVPAAKSIGNIYSRNCRTINQVNVSQVQIYETEGSAPYGSNELDTHANTTSAGNNFWVLSYTDKVCEVSPYHPDCDPIMDVPTV